MFKILTLAGALALIATTAEAQYAYLPPGYCGYDYDGNLIPCGYDYGYGGAFVAPFFGGHRFFHRGFHDHDFGHGFAPHVFAPHGFAGTFHGGMGAPGFHGGGMGGGGMMGGGFHGGMGGGGMHGGGGAHVH